MSDAFDDVLVEDEIIHFTAQEGDHHKMGMIERFNRTMKALLSIFVTYNTKGMDRCITGYGVQLQPYYRGISTPWKQN